MMFCFFMQKTEYEMRISDWSSDVCSSDLVQALPIEIEMKVLARKLRRPLESRLPLVLQGCLHQGDIGEVREHVGQPATGTLLIPRIGTAVIRHDPDDAPRPAAFFDGFELPLPERPLAPVALLPAPYSRLPHLIEIGRAHV